MKHFDFLIVGAGLYGATVANLLARKNRSVLVVEKSNHVGGTVYTESQHGVQVHVHGAHIFKTDDAYVWEYIKYFDNFVPFINAPLAIHDDIVYNLPFNMNTFSNLWGIKTPEEAKNIIAQQIADYRLVGKPKNLEEFAISTVGTDIYENFIKEYTEKQWGKKCSELPPDLMKRIPLRFTYNNNYYDVRYQGIPVHGYTALIDTMLDNIPVILGVDGKQFVRDNRSSFSNVIYTGPIDEFFDYKYGRLEYRSLRFDTEYIPDIDSYQGNAVVNYSDANVAYTRVIEHKHFLGTNTTGTVITREYPCEYNGLNYPYYPIETKENRMLYDKYVKEDESIHFRGRLGSYRYYDMSDTIKRAMKEVRDVPRS